MLNIGIPDELMGNFHKIKLNCVLLYSYNEILLFCPKITGISIYKKDYETLIRKRGYGSIDIDYHKTIVTTFLDGSDIDNFSKIEKCDFYLDLDLEEFKKFQKKIFQI